MNLSCYFHHCQQKQLKYLIYNSFESRGTNHRATANSTQMTELYPILHALLKSTKPGSSTESNL